MPRKRVLKNEKTLQVLWAKNVFAGLDLRTTSGKRVQIFDPGKLNHLDGPDFNMAKVRIGDQVHFGAVEVHLENNNWYSHKHHLDPNYNAVILHVVVEDTVSKEVKTENEVSIPTLNVMPYLNSVLHLEDESPLKSGLICSSLVRSLSPKVFARQIDKAHREYLEVKVNTFFSYFDAHDTLSCAWKNALFITLCDALGVPNNREQMKTLAGWMIKRKEIFKDLEVDDAASLNSLTSRLNWNSKGQRWQNSLKNRTGQAIKLYSSIQQKSLDFYLETNVYDIWEQLRQAINLPNTEHNHRLFVSFFLPAIYGLGKLFHSEKMIAQIYQIWMREEVKIPASILKKFGIFNSPEQLKTMKRIGLVHQFNTYCEAQHCSRCEVLNKAISS